MTAAGAPDLGGGLPSTEPETFARLLDRHAPALRAYCRRLMGEPAAAEDLAQETLLQALQARETLQDPARFGAWLRGIAGNLAKWWWRRRLRAPVSLERLEASELEEGWAHGYLAVVLADRAGGPEEAVLYAERQRLLVDAVDALPEALRSVVRLHYAGELSYARVAAALGLPVSVVRGRLFRSRAALRRALGADPRYSPRLPQPPPAKGTRAMPANEPDPTTGPRARPTAPLVEVELYGVIGRSSVAADGTLRIDSPAGADVELREKNGERRLRIAVGAAEADALRLALAGVDAPRPLTHDLMAALLASHGSRVARVEIPGRLENGAYLATLALTRRARVTEMDARPSDAIVLALRAQAPVLVAEELLDDSLATRTTALMGSPTPEVPTAPGTRGAASAPAERVQRVGIRCPFCGQNEFRGTLQLIVVGPNKLAVCDECVATAARVVEEGDEALPTGWRAFRAARPVADAVV